MRQVELGLVLDLEPHKPEQELPTPISLDKPTSERAVTVIAETIVAIVRAVGERSGCDEDAVER